MAVEAFPGARGPGRWSEGGRGGDVVFVTNLQDKGPGSLRDCVQHPGPTVCVFRVGGTIMLQSPLWITRPRLSILGQTAPGGGVLITSERSAESTGETPLIIKGTNDVVLQHIRVRLQYSSSTPNVDALTVEDSSSIYIDHFSGSWATDENFNLWGDSNNVTVAYSIWAEGIMHHSKCALAGGANSPQNYAFWRNLCFSNQDRNPDDNHPAGSCIEISENVFYNAGSQWSEIFSQKLGGTPINFVNNYYKAGRSTNNQTNAIDWDPTDAVSGPRIYQRGNVVWAPKGKSVTLVAADTLPYIVDNPTCNAGLEYLTTAEDAYSEVKNKAGAFPRDTVDARLIGELGVVGGRGKATLGILNDPPLLPVIAAGTPYRDIDNDGLPDSVEAMFGGIVGEQDQWSDPNGDGWTIFDEVMNWLSGQRILGNYPD
jgi:pectate lyase